MRTDLTSKEAVEFLRNRCHVANVSQNTLRAWRRCGILKGGRRVYLPARKIGGHFRYAESDLFIWVCMEPDSTPTEPVVQEPVIQERTHQGDQYGLPRTNADKRLAVMALLTDEEWSQWSNRRIARQCHVSCPFVAKLRGKLLAKPATSNETTRGLVDHGLQPTELNTQK